MFLILFEHTPSQRPEGHTPTWNDSTRWWNQGGLRVNNALKFHHALYYLSSHFPKSKENKHERFLRLPVPHKFHLLPQEAGAPPIRGHSLVLPRAPGQSSVGKGWGWGALPSRTHWSVVERRAELPPSAACEGALCHGGLRTEVCAGPQTCAWEPSVSTSEDQCASSPICLCGQARSPTWLYL